MTNRYNQDRGSSKIREGNPQDKLDMVKAHLVGGKTVSVQYDDL